jgi:hypothetical protein
MQSRTPFPTGLPRSPCQRPLSPSVRRLPTILGDGGIERLVPPISSSTNSRNFGGLPALSTGSGFSSNDESPLAVPGTLTSRTLARCTAPR